MTGITKQSRRKFLAGLAVLPVVTACSPARTPAPLPPAEAFYFDQDPDQEVFIDFDKDTEAKIHGIKEPQYVTVDASIEPEQILVFQDELKIQYVYAPGLAIEYPVALGRAGLEFSGDAVIQRKAEWPSWRPTDEMIARNPDHYAQFADGVPGGRNNPLGARALYLYKDGVDTYYRIHGTDAPTTIGSYVSNGCIRMLNDHVMDLYERVNIGTKVHVIQS